jgi:hypothetical protein
LTSGKLNEVIDLCVGEIKGFSGRRHNGRIKAESPLGALRRDILNGPLDATQNHLAGGTALAGRRLMQTAMQSDRDVQGSSNSLLIHKIQTMPETLIKSIWTLSSSAELAKAGPGFLESRNFGGFDNPMDVLTH